jgi:hypothetical protein
MDTLPQDNVFIRDSPAIHFMKVLRPVQWHRDFLRIETIAELIRRKIGICFYDPIALQNFKA